MSLCKWILNEYKHAMRMCIRDSRIVLALQKNLPKIVRYTWIPDTKNKLTGYFDYLYWLRQGCSACGWLTNSYKCNWYVKYITYKWSIIYNCIMMCLWLEHSLVSYNRTEKALLSLFFAIHILKSKIYWYLIYYDVTGIYKERFSSTRGSR